MFFSIHFDGFFDVLRIKKRTSETHALFSNLYRIVIMQLFPTSS